MIFWYVLVSFLSVVLFFTLSPKEDRIKTVDFSQAQSAITAFINQHKAARFAVTHNDYVFYRNFTPDKGAINPLFPVRENNGLALISPHYVKTLTGGLFNISYTQLVPSLGLASSALACVNTDNTLDRNAQDQYCVDTNDFVITYGFLQSSWKQIIIEKQLWRPAMEILNKNLGDCGTLTVTNGQYTFYSTFSGTTNISPAIGEEIYKKIGDTSLEVLLCISKIKNGAGE